MTTGPGHYALAEAHLADAADSQHICPGGVAGGADEATFHLAAAQAHATLALAAATALAAVEIMAPAEGGAWLAVLTDRPARARQRTR
jgi:hypothetical protein